MNEHITTVHCVNAWGDVFEGVYVIFSKNIPAQLDPRHLPENWRYGQSESGYINSELFFLWFRYKKKQNLSETLLISNYLKAHIFIT